MKLQYMGNNKKYDITLFNKYNVESETGGYFFIETDSGAKELLAVARNANECQDLNIEHFIRIHEDADIEYLLRKKMADGALKYGEYIPSEDTRNLLVECSEEILDAINYLRMHKMKKFGVHDYLELDDSIDVLKSLLLKILNLSEFEGEAKGV